MHVNGKILGFALLLLLLPAACTSRSKALRELGRHGAVWSKTTDVGDTASVMFGRGGHRLGDAEFAALIPFLQDLGRLEYLDVSQMNLTDASVAPLLKLREVTVLHIEGTHFSPAAVEQLAQLPRLELLFVSPCTITADQASDLSERVGLPVKRHLGVRTSQAFPPPWLDRAAVAALLVDDDVDVSKEAAIALQDWVAPKAEHRGQHRRAPGA